MLNKYSLVIHGGAGAMSKGKLSQQQELDIEAILKKIVDAGLTSLKNSESALSVVQQAVRELENCPWFNAGVGAVYNSDSTHEMDASIMCGISKEAGAVSGIRYSPNPIDVARKVLDESPHVYLAGIGAEKFALSQGLPQVKNEYFSTELRKNQLISAKKSEKDGGEIILEPTKNDYKFGTVGAVAFDTFGNLAAATSTGGIVNKEFGRVGDSPIIGSGTYADNETCAISSTGHGEHFLRHVVAFNIASRIKFKNQPLDKAAHDVIHKELLTTNGQGGIIGVDKLGNITMPFNTEGMYRGWGTNTEEGKGKIYS